MKTIARARRPFVRAIREPLVIRVHQATFIPDGMHGVGETQRMYRSAVMVPDGMHAFPFVDKKRILDDVVEGLIAKGVDPFRARTLVNRVAWKRQTHGLEGLGDVVADATTWITYGNDIIERSKTGNVGDEALKAAGNINTFLGNRGDELQSTSPATVDALGEMLDKLGKIGVGQMKYNSVAGSFFDEFGNAIRGEVIVGARAVAAAPGKLARFVAEDVVKPALDVIPWYVWAGGAAAGAAILTKALKIW